MYKKITMTLLHLSPNCQLRFHVNLFNKETETEEVFHTVYYDEYIHINFRSFVTLEIKDGEWDKSKSITITNRNIYQLIRGVKQVIDNIYKKDTFEIVGGRTIITPESIKENTVDIYLGLGNAIRISPTVIYDIQEDNYYEGVIIYLNKGQNSVEIHYTVLEALWYELKKINFVIYSDILIRFYLDYLKETKDGENKLDINKKKVNVFDFQVETVIEETDGKSIKRNVPSMDEFF